jgi:Protein of unknown function (DUF1573)
MTALISTHCRSRLLLLAAIPGLAGIAALSLSRSGTTTSNHLPPPFDPSSSIARPFPLEISPDPVSLGVVRSGQKASATLTLVNRGLQVLAIERIETSCSCLMITPESIRIGPGESKVLMLEFDPSAEPDFAAAFRST